MFQVFDSFYWELLSYNDHDIKVQMEHNLVKLDKNIK